MENGMEFFTATCLNWQNLLGTERHKQIIMESLKFLTSESYKLAAGWGILKNLIDYTGNIATLWTYGRALLMCFKIKLNSPFIKTHYSLTFTETVTGFAGLGRSGFGMHYHRGGAM